MNPSSPKSPSSRTRIKICGITREADLHAALAAGVDALGFVLYPHSPRHVPLARALELASQVPPFVTPVFLFVNAPLSAVQAAHQALPRAVLQLHGDESPEWGAQLGLPHLRAIRVPSEPSWSDAQLLESMQIHRACGLVQAFLLDAQVATYGGAGQSFDWTRFDWPHIQENAPSPLVFGGGLTAANVSEVIRTVRPWAVDVSSGVEAAKGIKDPQKIQQFVQAVQWADQQLAPHANNSSNEKK